MNKRQQERQQWIEDTQMFQRVAKVPETSAEALGADWDSWNKPRKVREAESAATHRGIIEMCQKKV